MVMRVFIVSQSRSFELTFTVTDFNVVTSQQLYDILGKYFEDIIVAAHQPDDNNKNTHYHAMFGSKENLPIPSDFENKSSQEQAARRKWKKLLGTIDGVTRIHYGRVKDRASFTHYILVKCLEYVTAEDLKEYCEEAKVELWCKDNLECICKNCSIKNKLPKKTKESLTQFEIIMKEFKKDRICQHVTDGICMHCYENGVIQMSMIKHYLRRGKAVPIGKCAEMMLSAKAILAPDERTKQEAEYELMQSISAKMQNNLKIY
jgi:hypothetical protein